MSCSDPELRALLVGELVRHANVLRTDALDDDQVRRVLHAVKGTAGVAGEQALSDAFGRLERLKNDPQIAEYAHSLLTTAIERLEAGEPAYDDPWPVPPKELRGATVARSVAARYEAEMRDRTSALDSVLEAPDPKTALLDALRHVHSMKGAAASVGDDVMAWFCHGLESRIHVALDTETTMGPMLDELGRWRTVLTGLAQDPEGTLELLRGGHHIEEGLEAAEHKTRTATAEWDAETWLRVPAYSLDMVLERLRGVSLAARELNGQGESLRGAAQSLRSARQRLLEARRLIGPPRPWGAPAAALEGIEEVAKQVGVAAAQLELVASTSRHRSLTIGQNASASQTALGTVRRATMALVFDRVIEAIEAATKHAGVEVRIEQIGASTPVDRRLAEALMDPVLQLARNAVAHGIEEPALRLTLGKPRWGRLVLSSEVRGAHLLVGVHDDGCGVDEDALRADAIRSGRISTESAHDICDESLLNLLFLPGVTMRTTADLLAGRGLGLDVSLQTARRLGGTIRIRNRPGRGLTAVVDVPLVERGQARVLWVRSLGNRFALTARYVLSARLPEPGRAHPPALATWIDPSHKGNEQGMIIDIGRSPADRVVSVGIASIEGIEEAIVRPVPPLVALAGPYVGVIVGTDGHPSLLVDALLVSDRATWTQRDRASSFPPPARTDYG